MSLCYLSMNDFNFLDALILITAGWITYLILCVTVESTVETITLSYQRFRSRCIANILQMAVTLIEDLQRLGEVDNLSYANHKKDEKKSLLWSCLPSRPMADVWLVDIKNCKIYIAEKMNEVDINNNNSGDAETYVVRHVICGYCSNGECQDCSNQKSFIIRPKQRTTQPDPTNNPDAAFIV